jgi:hypothetical protein
MTTAGTQVVVDGYYANEVRLIRDCATEFVFRLTTDRLREWSLVYVGSPDRRVL